MFWFSKLLSQQLKFLAIEPTWEKFYILLQTHTLSGEPLCDD